ncbi:MAG: hypothetical protein WC350_06045 [Candidatus Micrarchaeia archaeon]
MAEYFSGTIAGMQKCELCFSHYSILLDRCPRCSGSAASKR